MTTTNKIHEGRNVKRFREMKGMKQEALAIELGQDWTQKKVSLLEQKETIDLPILQQVSAALQMPVEAFQQLDEEQSVNIISNTFHDIKDNASGITYNNKPSFNPIDKVVELYEENKQLYERMLKEKDEMIAKLERLLEKK